MLIILRKIATWKVPERNRGETLTNQEETATRKIFKKIE